MVLAAGSRNISPQTESLRGAGGGGFRIIHNNDEEQGTQGESPEFSDSEKRLTAMPKYSKSVSLFFIFLLQILLVAAAFVTILCVLVVQHQQQYDESVFENIRLRQTNAALLIQQPFLLREGGLEQIAYRMRKDKREMIVNENTTLNTARRFFEAAYVSALTDPMLDTIYTLTETDIIDHTTGRFVWGAAAFITAQRVASFAFNGTGYVAPFLSYPLPPTIVPWSTQPYPLDPDGFPRTVTQNRAKTQWHRATVFPSPIQPGDYFFMAALSTPIVNDPIDGRVRTVVAVTCNVTEVKPIALAARLTETSTTLLFDVKNNLFLISTDTSFPQFDVVGERLWTIQDFPHEGYRSIYLEASTRCNASLTGADEGCTFDSYSRGDKIISIVLVSTDTGILFHLLQITPRSFFYEKSEQSRAIGIVIGVVAALLVVASCVMVYFSIQGPLSTVMEAMQLAAVMRNDEASEVSAAGRRSFLSEILAIQSSFYQMNNCLKLARPFLPQHLLLTAEDEDAEEDDGEEFEDDEDDYYYGDDISSTDDDGSESATRNGQQPDFTTGSEYAIRLEAGSTDIGRGGSSRRRGGGTRGGVRGRYNNNNNTINTNNAVGGATNRSVHTVTTTDDDRSTTTATLGPLSARGKKKSHRLQNHQRTLPNGNNSGKQLAHGDAKSQRSAVANTSNYHGSTAAVAGGGGGVFTHNELLGGNNRLLSVPGKRHTTAQYRRVGVLTVNLLDFHQLTLASSYASPYYDPSALHRHRPLVAKEGGGGGRGGASTAPYYHYAPPPLTSEGIVNLHGRLAKLIESAANSEKGIVESFQGDHFTIVFNAARACATVGRAGSLCALQIAAGGYNFDKTFNDKQHLIAGGANNKATPTIQHTAGGRKNVPSGADGAAVPQTTPRLPTQTLSSSSSLVAPPRIFSMGFASGRCLVGNMGTSTMKRLCIVGPAFTEAMALERLAKRVGHRCLVSSRSMDGVETAVYTLVIGKARLPSGALGSLPSLDAATQQRQCNHFVPHQQHYDSSQGRTLSPQPQPTARSYAQHLLSPAAGPLVPAGHHLNSLGCPTPRCAACCSVSSAYYPVRAVMEPVVAGAADEWLYEVGQGQANDPYASINRAMLNYLVLDDTASAVQCSEAFALDDGASPHGFGSDIEKMGITEKDGEEGVVHVIVTPSAYSVPAITAGSLATSSYHEGSDGSAFINHSSGASEAENHPNSIVTRPPAPQGQEPLSSARSNSTMRATVAESEDTNNTDNAFVTVKVSSQPQSPRALHHVVGDANSPHLSSLPSTARGKANVATAVVKNNPLAIAGDSSSVGVHTGVAANATNSTSSGPLLRVAPSSSSLGNVRLLRSPSFNRNGKLSKTSSNVATGWVGGGGLESHSTPQTHYLQQSSNLAPYSDLSAIVMRDIHSIRGTHTPNTQQLECGGDAYPKGTAGMGEGFFVEELFIPAPPINTNNNTGNNKLANPSAPTETTVPLLLDEANEMSQQLLLWARRRVMRLRAAGGSGYVSYYLGGTIPTRASVIRKQ